MNFDHSDGVKVYGEGVIDEMCIRDRISIEPHLGKLEWAKGTYPTPWGVIEVSHEKKADGKIATKVKLPKGVKPVSYTHLDVYKRQTKHRAQYLVLTL